MTVVRHPLGKDTLIVVGYPTAAHPGARYGAEAIGYDGKRLGTTPAIATPDGLQFMCAGFVGGERVEYYRVRQRANVFMPILLE